MVVNSKLKVIADTLRDTTSLKTGLKYSENLPTVEMTMNNTTIHPVGGRAKIAWLS